MSKLTINQVLVSAAVVRLVVALCTYGTNDPFLWHKYGMICHEQGFLHAWKYDPWLNHPPLPLAWAYLWYELLGTKLYLYCLAIKLPPMLGDLLAVRVIWLLAVERGITDRNAVRLASLYAFNPIAILISAYHGNTDSLMAALLLCAFRYALLNNMLLGGLMLGAAINVKLAPVPCIILLFASARSWRGAADAFSGLALWAIPFIPVLAVSFEAFVSRAIFYLPLMTSWGLMVPFTLGTNNPDWERFSAIAIGYHRHLTLVVLFSVAFALAWRIYRRRMNPLDGGAAFFCFLVAWTTASVQYLVWPLPLLAAARPRMARWYGVAGGIYIGYRYFEHSVGRFPLFSFFTPQTSPEGPLIGLLPWFALVIAFVLLLRREPGKDQPALAPTPQQQAG